WGQANFGIRGKLEQERLILELEEHILDTPMLFVRHGDGQLQVKWSRQRDMIQLDISWVDSKAGIQIPMYHDSRIRSHILGRFPMLGDKKAPYTIDATDLFLNADISWKASVPETIYPQRTYIDT